MDREPPYVEPLPRVSPYSAEEPVSAWSQSPRVKLFSIVFALVFVTGLVATLLQPRIYRASATVLMTAPAAVDDVPQEANRQSVAIQRRILLGNEVMADLAQALGGDASAAIDASDLRQILRVEPVADTNLVEMIARGTDKALLPPLVNTWIDEYLAVRAREIETSQQQTLRQVRDQLAGLEAQLTAARDALASFRAEHGISSGERGENEVVARLEGLNEALNSAIEKEVQAKTRLRSLEDAIARGKKIVPVSDRESVSSMEQELRKLRTQLAGLTRNYTMEYVRKQPRFRDIPVRIEELEQALAETYEEGQAVELAVARQQYDAARQTVRELQAQVDARENDAAAFTGAYSRHQALTEDLAELEELHRQTRSRLVEVQVSAADKYPQVAVIDRPAPRSIRVGPDYLLWLGGSVAAALALAILSVWLYGFLGPRPRPAYVTLSGVHMYPGDSGGLPQMRAPQRQIGQSSSPRLNDRSADNGDEEDGGEEGPGEAPPPKV